MGNEGLSALLELTTELITKDLGHIKTLCDVKLEHDVAQDLVRYHQALTDSKFQEIQASKKEDKSLSELSTEELIARAQDTINQYKKGTRK